MRYGGFELDISNRGNKEFLLLTDKYFEGRTARLLVFKKRGVMNNCKIVFNLSKQKEKVLLTGCRNICLEVQSLEEVSRAQVMIGR